MKILIIILNILLLSSCDIIYDLRDIPSLELSREQLEDRNKIYAQQHNFTINYNTKQIWLIDSRDTMTILHIHPIK